MAIDRLLSIYVSSPQVIYVHKKKQTKQAVNKLFRINRQQKQKNSREGVQYQLKL